MLWLSMWEPDLRSAFILEYKSFVADTRPSFFPTSVKLVDSACFVQMTFTDLEAWVCVRLFLFSHRMMADAFLPLF